METENLLSEETNMVISEEKIIRKATEHLLKAILCNSLSDLAELAELFEKYPYLFN